MIHHDISSRRPRGRGWLRPRMLWLGPVTLVLTIALPSHAPAETRQTEGYRLGAVYEVPDAAPRSLVRPVRVKVDLGQREIVALETEPPSVVVLTPDGSILRRFGSDVLRLPSDLAPVYPDSDPRSWNGDVARIMVTEAALGRLHVFDVEGRLLQTIQQEDWAPSAIVGITTRRLERALVIDDKHGRIVALDWDGRALTSGVPGAAANLSRPTLIAGSGSQHLVYDAATRRLVWFDHTGSVLKDLAFDGLPALSAVGSVAAIVCDGSTALLATDRGLLAVGWQLGFTETSPTIQQLLGPGLQEPFVALDLFRNPDAAGLFYRTLELYGLQHDPPVLTRYVSTDSDFWVHAEFVASAVHPGCPFVWERPAYAWRLAVIAPDTPAVLTTNGVVLQLVDGEIRATGQELGYIDDWVVEPSGLITTLADGYPTTFRPVPSGLTTGTSYWNPQVDCIVSGIGFRPSISSVATRATETTSYLAAEGSRASGRLTNRLGLSFDLVAFDVLPEGRLTYTGGREVVVDSRQAIGAPLLSDVSVNGDGRLAAVVDRLGGRVLLFGADQQMGWKLTARWPVPGRPDRVEWTPDGALMALTADGWIWRLDGTGHVTTGWDAAGMGPAPRPALVDIGVGAAGTVYALDKYGRRLLEYVPSGQPAAEPPPSLPPPCRVQTTATAYPTRVAVGQPVTATLGLSGACGRVSAQNDIVILMQPPERGSWTAAAFQSAVSAFVGELAPDKDRVGLTVFDAASDIMVPLGTDFAAVSAAAGQVASMTAEYDMAARPLLWAAEQFDREPREEANRVVLLFTTGAFTRRWAVDHLTIDSDTLREAGIRVIVVCSDWQYSRLPALLAYQPDDYYLAPDGDTMRAVYAQLGREFGARVLLRDLLLDVTLPSDMDYVASSAQPVAAWDPGTRTLRWVERDLPFGGWRASLQVRPSQIGRRPAIHLAEGDAIDGFGNRFPVSFTIPWIEVFEPPTPTATPTATAAPTVTPTVESKVLYLPLALTERCGPTLVRADVILVLDTSSSMEGSKLADAKEAAVTFVRLMDLTAGHDQVAVVRFDSDAELVSELSRDLAAVARAIRGLEARQGTRIDLGLLRALDELQGPRRIDGNTAAVVLLTDGIQTGARGEELSAAQRLKDVGVRLYTIGLGPDVDEATLIEMAGGASRYYFAPGSRDLKRIYTDVAHDIACPAERFWGRR